MRKSFRGLLTSDSITEVRLHTIRGLRGYIIKKFQCITDQPSAYDVEGCTKIYAQTRDVDASINFDDPALMAVSYNTFGNQPYEPTNIVTIFDNTTVNQDLFITYIDSGGNSRPMNFYLELELFTLSENEAAVATLKDMRGS